MDNGTSDTDRNGRIYDLYLLGETLQNIGEKYKLTRQRVQQLITKEITIRIKRGLWSGKIKNPEHKRIRDLVNDEIQRIKLQKKHTKTIRRLKAAKEKGIVPEKYSSIQKFASDVGVNLEIITSTAPEIPLTIRENMPISRGGKKWSRSYVKCRMCGDTKFHHACHGYCRKCYPKTDMFKDIQLASRMRNKEKWKPKQRKYLASYYNKKNYGGLKTAVLERDHYLCAGCNLSDKDSLKKYGKHLRVIHLNDSADNDINNLITACLICSLKYIRSKRK